MSVYEFPDEMAYHPELETLLGAPVKMWIAIGPDGKRLESIFDKMLAEKQPKFSFVPFDPESMQ